MKSTFSQLKQSKGYYVQHHEKLPMTGRENELYTQLRIESVDQCALIMM